MAALVDSVTMVALVALVVLVSVALMMEPVAMVVTPETAAMVATGPTATHRFRLLALMWHPCQLSMVVTVVPVVLAEMLLQVQV